MLDYHSQTVLHGLWAALQMECPDLCRTHAHLTQGTRPSRKVTNARDIKRYLQVASISKDGVLIVPQKDVLSPARECIIVPRQIIDGLLTALHIKLNHPAANQLKLLFRRYFHTLDADKAISRSSQSCYQCAALQKIPHTMVPQSTSDPPDGIGFSFAADVIKRQQQLIFVVRETITSYTAACLISDERHN